ncbi:MAG TPA: hypothetical protein VM639_12945 [Dongiaceae bacterium]|nr:hypothetical protein [Dongiaceae bacterium]
MTATIADVLDFVIHHRPGLNERDLSTALYGSPSYEHQVEAECSRLVSSGQVNRCARPDGGHAYYPGIATPAELGR